MKRKHVPTVYEVERAAGFLDKHDMMGKVSPLTFAGAAKETGKSFDKLLAYVRELLAAGSGVGPAPIATKIALRAR